MKTDLRTKVKLLKAQQDITYKELAQYIEVSQSSFYCWLKGYYELSIEKQMKLNQIINILKE